MEIKLKMRDVLAAYTTLQNLDLPAPIALKIMRAARPLEAEFAAYEQQRLRLVNKYGQKSGGQVMVAQDSEQWPRFAAEIQQLLDVDITVEIEPLPIEALGPIRITPAALGPILFLFAD